MGHGSHLQKNYGVRLTFQNFHNLFFQIIHFWQIRDQSQSTGTPGRGERLGHEIFRAIFIGHEMFRPIFVGHEFFLWYYIPFHFFQLFSQRRVIRVLGLLFLIKKNTDSFLQFFSFFIPFLTIFGDNMNRNPRKPCFSRANWVQNDFCAISISWVRYLLFVMVTWL